jgi:exonuclease VII small subunit
MSSKNKETIQEKMAKLDELLMWFDGEAFELEKSLAMFTEAEKLAEEIEHDLLTLKNDIQVVKKRFDEAQ